MGYRKNFFNCFRELRLDIGKRRNRTEGEMWLRINKYLLEGNYSTIKKAPEYAKLWLEGYTNDVIAIKMNIEEATVRVNRKSISDSLYSIFGNDFFELFLSFTENYNEIKERVTLAEHRTQSGSFTANSCIPLDVYVLMKEAVGIHEQISFNLDDCRKELNFLRRYSIYNIKEDINGLDINKLGFLIDLLDGNAGEKKDLYRVLKELEGV